MQLFVLFCAVVCVESISFPRFEKWIFKDDKPCGTEASTSLIHHNPWLVYLEYYDMRGSELTLRCGGTLIGSKHVVTAAHCVKNGLFNRIVARLGEYDLNTRRDCVRGVCADPVLRIHVKQIHVAPGYDGVDDDIAVLELEREAPYTDFIRPICLPSSYTGAVMFSAAGWGEIVDKHIYSHIKKIIPLPSWTEENCRKAYSHLNLPKNIICAGGEEGIDTCRGDSGGPLTLNRGRIEIVGVTSSGNAKCGTWGFPGIYTSVLKYLEWIKMVVDKDS